MKPAFNTNTANTTRFQLIFNRLPSIVFMCSKVHVPGFRSNPARMPTPFRNIPLSPDTAELGELVIDFLINEDYSNWWALYNWGTQLAFVQSFDQYKTLETSVDGLEGDAIVNLYSNQQNLIGSIDFTRVFPTGITPLSLDSQSEDPSPMIASATFQFLTMSQR